MSGDFNCTHCGTRYDVAPGRCRNCGENTVRYLPEQTWRTPVSQQKSVTQTSSATTSSGSGLLGIVVLLIVLGVLFG